MSEAVAKKRNDKALRKLVAGVVSAIGETLSSLVDHQLQVMPGTRVEIPDADDWLSSIGSSKSIIRGSLDKDFAGKHLLIALDHIEAITLSGFLMMTPEEVINEHRATGTLEGDNLEAFGEVGNVLCSGIDGTLREVIGPNVGLRLQDHGMIKPGFDQNDFLPDGNLVLYNFTIQVGEYPQTEAFLLLDPETAQQWNNDKPVLVEDTIDTGSTEATDTAVETSSTDDQQPLEEIPQATVRGRMAAFVSSNELHNVLRRCGRRVGLEMQRFNRTDIPNPAAHRGQIVLIEIPVGDDRRFDWAKRIKAHHAEIPVVLLLHQPSRSRVVQGFMAQANAVCAWPSTEPELSPKLEAVLVAMIAASQAAEDEED